MYTPENIDAGNEKENSPFFLGQMSTITSDLHS